MPDERIPDAIAAVIAGVLETYPSAPAASVGRMVVRELQRDGWVIAPGRDRPPAQRAS